MVSPSLAAGIPFIRTLVLPVGTIPPMCGTGPDDSGQVWKSPPARQAGMPSMRTFELPVPVSGGPCAVGSSTRAAGGIRFNFS
jgi:hypothetical protein